jgi:arylsulfatase A-like enzyme
MVGKIIAKLAELGIDTIALLTTDNGASADWYPDGGATPLHGEKATTWEGGVRVPMPVRWPKRIPGRKVSNGIRTHYDLFSTLIAFVQLAGASHAFVFLLEIREPFSQCSASHRWRCRCDLEGLH